MQYRQKFTSKVTFQWKYHLIRNMQDSFYKFYLPKPEVSNCSLVFSNLSTDEHIRPTRKGTEHNGHCERGWHDWKARKWLPDYWCPFDHYYTHHDSSLQMQMSKGIRRVTACLQLFSHWLTWGVMATSFYIDLCPGARKMGMMWNLSAQEVRMPPKTMICNVQMAEIVPNMKALNPTSDVLPLKEQKNH